MEVTDEMIYKLYREGYSYIDAKNALCRANGDIDVARELLSMSKLDMAVKLVTLEKRVRELERIAVILRP
jgi:translation elongation factor EF-Ts